MARHFSTHRSVCWRLSRYCNRACGFCLSTSSPRRPHPEHDPFLIADRLHELKVEKISYSGGEPFEYPAFSRLVRHVGELGILQLVTTNGDRLSNEIPEWINSFEHLKLSFYGSRAVHDRLMGEGNYDQLLALANRLREVHGVTVGANYMLSKVSLDGVEPFLADMVANRINDVQFQTYIHNRRPGVDRRFALTDIPKAIAVLRDKVSGYVEHLPGGMNIHDYSQRDWFIVLDDAGRFTLPSGTGSHDHIMGRVVDDILLVDGERMSAQSALDMIWQRRYETSAIIDLA